MSIHCGQDTVFSSSIPSMGMGQSRKTPADGAFVVTALLEPGIPRRMSPGKYLQLYTRGVPAIPLKPNREENDSRREPVPCLRHQGKFHCRDSYLPLSSPALQEGSPRLPPARVPSCELEFSPLRLCHPVQLTAFSSLW